MKVQIDQLSGLLFWALLCLVTQVVETCPLSSFSFSMHTLKTRSPFQDYSPRVTNSRGPGTNSCKLKSTSAALSEGFSATGQSFAPSTGTINAYMIFVDFPDAPASDTTEELYQLFVPGAPDWYKHSSFGQLSLNITADTSRFYRMPNPSTSYPYDRGITAQLHGKYIQDALNSVGQAIDFSGTDVLYIVPTKAAKHISFSPTYMGELTAGDGTVIGKTVTFGQDAPDSWGFLVMNHETGHTMGLPDLYPSNGGRATMYVGGHDIMGLISGGLPDYFAWHKWKLGWFSDDQFDCVDGAGSTTHTVTAVGTKEGVKAVVVKRDETTAIVAEVRAREGADIAACSTGVLVYTVSTSTASGQGPIRVHDATPNSGGCDGEELNDAHFTTEAGRDVFVSEDGVQIKVVSQNGDVYTIEVEAT
ncbi:unnamed protein product [Aspergillus oryzae]|uniref:Peptidase M6 immune inhibitor A n=3 Tax=Aspergillus oryzae TaxID=5062 RepID=A0A1S9DC53_ASPOZ|nr:peptidase M6 immune inhibitor A [Aspergillus oryzae]GMG51044.1 unnamed protein product [Aspergillus oryzae var. brunneus]GMF72632.1 unnamed protein product [Aspergillus oryzae]GMF90431.1 unnamed protein product [Aspergillus oryzae]GMG07541.1 unnamed protein product [Aspergillus oryzae]